MASSAPQSPGSITCSPDITIPKSVDSLMRIPYLMLVLAFWVIIYLFTVAIILLIELTLVVQVVMMLTVMVVMNHIAKKQALQGAVVEEVPVFARVCRK